MPFGFGGGSSKSSTSSTSSPGFGAGSMAAGRASERSNYGGTSQSSTSSSSKSSTATAAGRGSNAATGSKSTGSTATGGRVGTGSTSANRSSTSGSGDVGRFGGGSTGTTGKGFGAATGMSSTGSMAAARANDRASVAGYAGRPSATSTATGGRVGDLSGTMANARAADRASVPGYAGVRGPSSMAQARAADRASMPGYTAPRGLAPSADRYGPLTSQALADRMGPLSVTGLSATEPGVSVTTGVTPAGVALGKISPPTGLPDLATAPKAFVSYPKGATPPNTAVADAVAASWAAVYGAENVHITMTPHGGLRKGKGARSGRHGPDVGTAMDYGVSYTDPKTGKTRSLNMGNAVDKAMADKVAAYGAANFGLMGYGAGKGYMGNAAIHSDIQANPKSGAFAWSGPSAKSAAVDPGLANTLAQARATYNAASKTPSAPAPQQPVSSMIASAREMTPQMAALNQASGVASPTQTASVSPVSRVTSPQSAAAQPSRPSTPGSVQASATTPTAARPASVTPANRPAVQTNGKIPGGLAIQTPTKENPYKRSLTGEVVAAGIDVLSGPLGAVASLGTGLFLGSTVGGAAWDAAHGKYGENQYSPGDMAERQGGGAESYTMAQRNADKATAKAADGGAGTSTPAEDFVTKYIETSDPTWTSPAIRFTSSVEPMVLTPPKYNFEAPTAPFTYRRV